MNYNIKFFDGLFRGIFGIASVLVFAGILYYCIGNINNANTYEEAPAAAEDLQETALEDETSETEESTEIPEEFYGNWRIIDSEETNRYACVSKTYNYDDLIHEITADESGITVDNVKQNILSVKVESYNHTEMFIELNTHMDQFDFKDDECRYAAVTVESDGLLG
ncbi:MAG: hypothetical protein LUH47_00835 [Clostridiales bacterium]|nr:hypothetical protein [Clostridiales bacterium]